MRSSPFEDPVEIARREARARGVCPVTLLDDFFTEHWDHETLCSGFACTSCVGDPMADYFAEDDGWRPPRSHETEPEELEIPF